MKTQPGRSGILRSTSAQATQNLIQTLSGKLLVLDAFVLDAYVLDAYVLDAYVLDAYVLDAYVLDAYRVSRQRIQLRQCNSSEGCSDSP